MNENRGFKRKTIIKTINHKLEEWIKTIDDEALREQVKKDVIVTGGAIVSMLQGTLPNDYDVYFSNVETALKVAQYYLSKLPESQNDKVSKCEAKIIDNRVKILIKSAGVASETCNQADYDYFEYMPDNSSEYYLNKCMHSDKGKYSVVCMTTNAISLSDDIQAILRFTGSADEIHENYDFVHCTNSFHYDKDGNGMLTLRQEALESILAKEL